MKKGTIKVSVLYPEGEGKTFDMEYYCNQHIPMVKSLLGDAIIGVNVINGLAGGAPNTNAAYKTIGDMYFESIESFQNSFGPHAEKIGNDAVNFTNIEPIIQVSEVVI